VPEMVLPDFAIALSIDINIEFKPDIMIQAHKNHNIRYYPGPDLVHSSISSHLRTSLNTLMDARQGAHGIAI